MYATTIIISLLTATASFVSAAPIPDGGLTAGVITAVGVACAFQAEQCQKVGDGIKNGVVEVATNSGTRKLESIKTDGGIAATISDSIGNIMGGVKA
ncbi:hypothetical protein TWF281_002798 [Arthrobotrys megalospora]